MTDKTENLTYTEAIKVYARSEETGERVVKIRTGDEFWIEDGKPVGLALTGSYMSAGASYPAPSDAPFRVIKLEPKRKLAKTLEEALRAKGVKVIPPENSAVGECQFAVDSNRWRLECVCLFDLALRNGWDVEILED